jgi:hypothetical protein
MDALPHITKTVFRSPHTMLTVTAVSQPSQNKRRAKSLVNTQQWACAGRLSPTIQGLALLGVDPSALHRISFLH